MLTIAPEPASTITFSAARVVRRAMKKFICIAHSNSSSLVPRKPSSRIFTAPTLLTSTSTRPNSSTARATRLAGPSGAARSTATGVTRSRPSSVSIVREPATTEAPSAASSLRHRHPDPFAGPGDDGDLAVEAEIHQSSRPGSWPSSSSSSSSSPCSSAVSLTEPVEPGW